ncbi:beta-ketoacyl synthase [Gilvimarinus sp. SDUM040013]|uniref:Beta-ketoacyl synthase n=1 Tax=Gilvimarinus gilvus TaxID=3058038 RepID=A0ABU4RV70_9GAMM|nr:beta-ketoacyl synthase [Gilvimarinus sp. SDUM040013]MDO3386995.1 beta-ketoacyl synthase [Gilvimarinus sp. SDUM040013]MDX6848111.1 beta-ketoacyl synthase [Gilvimarinus sp. SDUM040013]
MSRLPVIVGFGGFNAAGRSSGHHGFRRMILESLPDQERQETLAGLGVMMGLLRCQDGEWCDSDGNPLTLPQIESQFGDAIRAGSLIRRIDSSFFDVDSVYWQKSAKLDVEEGTQSFVLKARDLPEPVPENWAVTELEGRKVRVEISGTLEVKLDSYREIPVKSAGQLPRGFNPENLYNARFHPRALQLAVIGASDAVRSVGVEWGHIAAAVQPDEVGVYASNVMSQMDDNGFGGLLQSRLRGGRVTTKQCPLGLNSMPADFVNAYILGSVGHTGAIAGACASFLYNLRAAVEDITSGRCRVAVVGNAEAPITSEIIDGYATMGALATEEKLMKIDAAESTDPARSSRPFGDNCGFTIAESSQYIVLMDDALALELGADIHGAVNDVFINADGYKKSISAPGPGNHITFAKAVASARAILGDEVVRTRSMVHAHGSSTPQNRVTESQIFDQVAEYFGVTQWPVAAIKAFVGHSLSPASGDQLIASLGTFKYGIVPGIKTIDKVADDVYAERLNLPVSDFTPAGGIDVAFLNSKGFGGNNATASILSPKVVDQMLEKRYGAARFADYKEQREVTRAQASVYDRAALRGNFDTIYQFGEGLIDESKIVFEGGEIRLPGFDKPVNLDLPNRFGDMV